MRINLGLGLKPQLQSLSSGLLILDLGLGFGTELGLDNIIKKYNIMHLLGNQMPLQYALDSIVGLGN